MSNTVAPNKLTKTDKFRKIVFLIPSLMGGGAERVLIALANNFRSKGYMVTIISINNEIPAYPIKHDIEVFYLINRDKNSIIYRCWYVAQIINRLIRILLKKKPACVISFITSANIWNGIACISTGTPYIVSERTSPDRSINRLNYINNKLAALIYKKAKAVVVSSQGVENCLLKNKAFKNLNNIYRITNSVPVFGKVSTTPVHHRKFILGVGRLVDVKGFDILITAFSNCGLADVDLLIVGEGEERAGLTCLIYNLGLRGRVILTGAKTNLQDYYSQAEMFVLPSRNEGYPNALVEAMSFGCPSIAVDCEFGPAEIINDGSNGILIKQGDIGKLTSGIVSLCNNPLLRKTLGNQAKLINQTNNARKLFKTWEDLAFSQPASGLIKSSGTKLRSKKANIQSAT